MGNGYGVCSNLASSGEPPPDSHDHFNHWRDLFAVAIGKPCFLSTNDDNGEGNVTDAVRLKSVCLFK